MKKMIRSLAALTALALLGAGLIACSSDDDKDPEPGVRIEGSKSVAVDGEITLTAKATDFSGDVTYTWESSDKTKATVTQNASDPSKATVKGIAEGSAKITVKAKAGDTEKTDEVTVTVGTTTSTGGKATAATYSFVGLVASDFLDSTGVAVSAWGAGASWAASSTVNLPGGTTTVKGASVFCKEQTQENASKQTQIRARTGADSKTTALNYNGGQADDDLSSGITIDKLDRYVSIDVDGAGTVTASVEFKGAKATDNATGGPFQAALVDEDGELIGTLVTDELTASSKKTVSGTVSSAGKVYLVFSRNGAKKGTSGTGGLDVTEIKVAPAE